MVTNFVAILVWTPQSTITPYLDHSVIITSMIVVRSHQQGWTGSTLLSDNQGVVGSSYLVSFAARVHPASLNCRSIDPHREKKIRFQDIVFSFMILDGDMIMRTRINEGRFRKAANWKWVSNPLDEKSLACRTPGCECNFDINEWQRVYTEDSAWTEKGYRTLLLASAWAFHDSGLTEARREIEAAERNLKESQWRDIRTEENDCHRPVHFGESSMWC